jgi:cobalt-zinc-cadmium efflux system outer membrane protein
VALLEDGLKEAHRWRYLGEVSVGLETERQTDRSRLTGPNLAIELPVFNHGDGRLARAESQLALAQSSVRSLELEVRRDVRAAAERVISAQQRGKALADTLIPAREAVYARTKEEVNYMLRSPFELIRARQQWLEARQQQLEAARDYWLARASLSRAIGARQAAPETAP